MQIPVCPTCGGSKWESVEEYAGGSRHYELRPDGWTLVNSFVELLETNYCCRDCDYDPSEDEDNDELLELLNDIDTAPTDDIESDRPAEDISAILRVGCQEPVPVWLGPWRPWGESRRVCIPVQTLARSYRCNSLRLRTA